MRVIVMRLTCPQCSTEYEVPDTALAPGRRLRCERCGHQWRQEAPDSAPPAPETFEPEAPPRPDRVTPENLPKFLTKRDPRGEPESTERRRGIGVESQPRATGRRGWIVLLVLLLLIIAALLAYRAV